VSVVDDFSREGTLLLGAGSAILLQVADPVVGDAANTYSNFATRPLDRLNNTLMYVYGTMLGTPEQAALVAKYTSRVHRGIPGAADPERQLWVAATLYATAVQVYERVHAPPSPDVAQTVLERYAALGTALEVPAALWPATTDQFAQYWTDAVAALEVTPAAQQVAHDLFHPVTAPWWMRASLPLAALLTADLLPESLRSGYGLPWSRGRARRAAAAWGIIRFLARVLPARLLSTPSRHYLARLDALAARLG
jgi:uncharacterized protein (DUF2236 family)